jgi:hypothetical protein
MSRGTVFKKYVASIVAFSLSLTVWAPAMNALANTKAPAASQRKDTRTDPNYVLDVYLRLETMLKSILKKHNIEQFDPNTVKLNVFLQTAKNPDRQKQQPLFKDILRSLNHEAYESSNGRYGMHKNGKKGTYGDIDAVVKFVAKKKPDWLGRLLYQGRKLSQTVFSLPTQKPKPISVAPQNPRSGQPQKRATREELVAYLNKLVNNDKVFKGPKGTCEAKTLRELTTSQKCSADIKEIKAAYPDANDEARERIRKINQDFWKTLQYQAYHASGRRCGIDYNNVQGKDYFNPYCTDILSPNPQKLSDKDRNQSFGGMLSTLTLGAYNAFTACMYAGYTPGVCAVKIPDEGARNLLQKTVLTKDGRIFVTNYVNKFLPENIKLDVNDKKFEFAVTFLSQTGPVFAFHWATNKVLAISQKNVILSKIISPTAAKIMIDPILTKQIAGAGAGIIVTLAMCDAFGQNCSKDLDYRNADEVQRFKSMFVVIGVVVSVFCSTSKTKFNCFGGIFSNIATEFAILQYGSSKATCLFCPVSKAGTVQSAAIHATYATGVLLYVREQMRLMKKHQWVSNLVKKSPKWFQEGAERLGATIVNLFQKTPIPAMYQKMSAILPPKLQFVIVGIIALVFGVQNGGKYGADLLAEYEQLGKKIECEKHVSCAESMVRSIKNIRRDAVLSWILVQSERATKLFNSDPVAQQKFQRATDVANTEQNFFKLIDPKLWAKLSVELRKKYDKICSQFDTASSNKFDKSVCDSSV